MADLAKVESRVDGHDRDLREITKAVDKLVLLHESSKEDRKEDREAMKSVGTKLDALADKMAKLIALEDKVHQNSKEITAVRHDVKNMESNGQAIGNLRDKIQKVEKELSEKLASATSDIKACTTGLNELKEAKLKADGGKEALGKAAIVFWSIFGSMFTAGAIALFIFIMKLYFGVDVVLENGVQGYGP